MSVRISPPKRELILAGSAILLAGASLVTFAVLFEGPVCVQNREMPSFFILPFVFSASVVFLMSRLISALLSRVVPRPGLAGLTGLLLAIGVHFALGLAGWVVMSDVPEADNSNARALVWIPFWIVGVFFKAGHLVLCD